jgi:hypothetical protein
MGKVGTGKINQTQVPKFYPTPVDKIELLISNLISQNETKITKDISYNLQYLEYLDFILDSKNTYLRLTEVLKKQTIKSFVITATGIIEAILYYLIVTNGQASTEWKSFMKISNTKTIEGKEYKIHNEIFRKTRNEETNTPEWTSVTGQVSGTKKLSSGVHIKIESEVFIKKENIKIEMNLDQMIKKAESHNLLGTEKLIYQKLHQLRQKRNKVHIRIIEEKFDTDWHYFDEKVLMSSKQILSALLKNVQIFTDEESSQEAFSYLDN